MAFLSTMIILLIVATCFLLLGIGVIAIAVSDLYI